MGVLEGFGANDWLPPVWLSKAPLGTRYLGGCHRALGMMSGVLYTGEPTSNAQVAFHVLVMATALAMFSYAIGVVAVIEEASSERQITLQSTTQYVRHVLRCHRLHPLDCHSPSPPPLSLE